MTSHDVRKLKICSVCEDIGIYKPKDVHGFALDLVVARAGSYVHPKCCGLKELLALPDSEIQSIRICDVGPKIMKALLGRKKQTTHDQ